MKPIVDEIAKRLRDDLTESMKDFEGLYVFGSQARGDATEESDLDIVVLLGNDYFRWPEAYHDVISQVDYDYFGVIDLDIHKMTRESLKRNPIFYNEVVNKGVYYGRV